MTLLARPRRALWTGSNPEGPAAKWNPGVACGYRAIEFVRGGELVEHRGILRHLRGLGAERLAENGDVDTLATPRGNEWFGAKRCLDVALQTYIAMMMATREYAQGVQRAIAGADQALRASLLLRWTCRTGHEEQAVQRKNAEVSCTSKRPRG